MTGVAKLKPVPLRGASSVPLMVSPNRIAQKRRLSVSVLVLSHVSLPLLPLQSVQGA